MIDDEAEFLTRLESDERWDTGELGRSKDHARRSARQEITVEIDDLLKERLLTYAQNLNLAPEAAVRFLLRAYLPKTGVSK